MAGRATFLIWVGEPGENWRVEPSFQQKHPSPHHLPFLEMEEHGLLRVCCSWGHFNRYCPKTTLQGTQGSTQTGTAYREAGAEPPRTGGPQFQLETSAT